MKLKLTAWVVLAALLASGIYLWQRQARLQKELPQTAGVDGLKSESSTPSPAVPMRAKNMPSIQPAPITPAMVDSLSPTLRPILDEKTNYSARLSATRAAKTNMAAADQPAIYAFLLRRNPLDEEQAGHVLKNSLLDSLCEMDPPPPGLRDVLIQIYRDEGQHRVLRDYAIQHLAAHYEQMEKMPDNGAGGRQQELARIQDVLWEALAETQSSIAGTALLGLARLAEGRPEFNRESIGAAALRLSREGAAGELTRITALQVCGRFDVQQALPLALQVVKQGDAQSMPLRISAVATIGALGGPQAKEFLTNVLNGAEERLKAPASHALNQIYRKELLAARANRKG
jgi:hypothetical protein